jgi:hypothetical protein
MGAEQQRPAAFEAWAIAAGFAYRDKHGFWFYRNGGDGLLEAWTAGAANAQKECNA